MDPTQIDRSSCFLSFSAAPIENVKADIEAGIEWEAMAGAIEDVGKAV